MHHEVQCQPEVVLLAQFGDEVLHAAQATGVPDGAALEQIPAGVEVEGLGAGGASAGRFLP